MGLWRLLRQPLVPAALGQTIGRAVDNGQGTAPDRSHLYSMGSGVGACNPRMVQCHLKQSKTDQLGRGVDVVLDKTRLNLCPVTAVLGYIALRGDQSGPFFLTTAKTPLSKSNFISKFCAILGRIGLPAEEYAGLRFRKGAATSAALSAALAGVEDSIIQLLGRWQSAAFLRYISQTLASNPTPTPQGLPVTGRHQV